MQGTDSKWQSDDFEHWSTLHKYSMQSWVRHVHWHCQLLIINRWQVFLDRAVVSVENRPVKRKLGVWYGSFRCSFNSLLICLMYRCEQVTRVRTVTSNANSLMQAGKDEDAFPVHADSTGTVDVLWVTEIERLPFFTCESSCCFHSVFCYAFSAS